MIEAVCGSEFVCSAGEDLSTYGRDQTLDYVFPFDLLVRPGSPEEIAAVLRICYQWNVPVTPRGGGSGVTGGALPVEGGVVLSLDRLNRIIDVDPEERYVIAESGVITADLCKAVEEQGLYFPAAPSSSSMSFIGGNVAVNAGSIHSCKYGKTGSYVLNLEVVLPTGEIIWTGANVAKVSTGFNLTQLFIGTEGTMGIITKVVIRLLPLPAHRILLLTAFNALDHACDTVLAIRRSRATPSAVELITENAIRFTAGYLQGTLPLVNQDVRAHLLIELEEDDEDKLYSSLSVLKPVLEKNASEDILVASTASEKQKLLSLRMNIGNAMTSGDYIYRDVDIAIPVRLLYQFIRRVEDICGRYSIRLSCFGHAADGNMHTMLFEKKQSGRMESDDLKMAINELYRYAIQLGGVISGEHGVGMLHRAFMPIQFSETHLNLMRNIKQVLDPKNLVNPGKLI